MGNVLSYYRLKRHTKVALDPFEYQPLPEDEPKIRLLCIPPKVRSGIHNDIDYTLYEATLDAVVPYIALSYSWGDPTPPTLISVNGHSCTVTANLAAALQNLQREDEEVTIWADALCINQKDPVEKTHQVQRMRDIYKAAQEVVIWLGPSTEYTDNTMKEIRKLGTQLLDIGIWELKGDDLRKWDTRPDDDSDAARIKRNILDLAAHHLANAKKEQYDFWWIMSDVGTRTWWRRIWCIQECANAKVATFRCGQEQVDSNTYWATAFYMHIFNSQALLEHEPGQEELFFRLKWLADKLTETFPTELLGIRRRYLTGGGHSLRTLLHMTSVHDSFTHRVQATDDRDRVYALLGIANDDVGNEIVADYTLTTKEAYTAVARVLLKHGHDDMLSLCRLSKTPSDLPSWVPDWRNLVRKPWSLWHEERMFDASKTGRAPMGIKEHSEASHLILEGAFVDTIAKVGTIWSINIDDAFDYPSALALLNDVDSYLSETTKYDDNQKEEASWRIPVGDTEVENLTNQMERAPTESHMKKGRDIFRTVADKTATPEEVHPHRRSWACYTCQMERMHNSRPFLSETGYVGMCPMQAEVGDRIVIFLGARTPYVVRRVDDTNLWRLVGETHVYGIMDGEFMESGTTVEDITLV
jgi:hypothetical protein